MPDISTGNLSKLRLGKKKGLFEATIVMFQRGIAFQECPAAAECHQTPSVLERQRIYDLSENRPGLRRLDVSSMHSKDACSKSTSDIS